MVGMVKGDMAERTHAQERLLEAAEELFYRHGIGATGVDRRRGERRLFPGYPGES